jgi:WD40 repeat protein
MGTEAVTCVVFSPDRKYIVSGSEDKTIRVWNVEIGAAIIVPLAGHVDEWCYILTRW